MYYTFSIVGWAYNQPSLVKPPGFALPTFSEEIDTTTEINQNGLVLSLDNQGSSQARPAVVRGLFAAQCALSMQLYKIMVYLTDTVHDRGRPNDLQQREVFWHRLMTFRATLPPHLKVESNFADYTVHLR
jgi:hypothetical protein